MAEGIQLLDLPQAAIGEIDGGNFAYMVTPDGRPFKVDISEMVAKMQADAGDTGVKLHTQNIAAAAMLNGGTTPIPVSIARQAGETISPIFPIVGSLVFNSAAFATNTVIGLRYVGADEPIATCDLLGRTASGTVNFEPVTTVAAGDSQYLLDTDLEIYVIGGDPTAGDSVTAVSFGYSKRV
jgi:hypothetical protein